MNYFKYVLLAFLFCMSVESEAQRLVMRIGSVFCRNTTEAGEDEIVISFVAQTTDGRSTAFVWPTLPGGASINDGNPPREYNNIYFDLPYLTMGQQCTVKFAVSEIDGGNSDLYLQAAQASLLYVCPQNPYCIGAIGFIELFHRAGLRIIDTDDFIGSINYNVFVDQYGLHVNYGITEKCYGVYSWNNIPNSMIVGFNGDGADYLIYLQFYYIS